MDWAEPGVAFEMKGCEPLLDPHWAHTLGNPSSALHAQHILADIQHGWDMVHGYTS